MAKRRPIKEETIDKAIEWAGKPGALEYSFDVVRGYEALRALFKKRLEFDDPTDAVACAYAVYGWMPTTLQNWKNEEAFKNLIEFSRAWKGREERSRGLDALANNKKILQAVNGSAVGTSKFLHFVAPEIFPIWDSRIAYAFRVTSRVNDPDTYIEFCRVLDERLEKSIKYTTTFENFMMELGSTASTVRKVEFCLYSYGKWKEKQDEDEKKKMS